MQVRDQTFQSHDATKIHFKVEGAGPPLVLVHGVGANLQSWDAIASALIPHFKVIRADLRGHGQSGKMVDCTMADFVKDLNGLLAHVGVEKVVLIGFSLGALIAQHYVLAHPERVSRLVLISSVADRTPEERDRVLKRAVVVRREGIAAVVGAAQDRWFTEAFMAANPERVARRLDELKANDHASYAAAYYVFAEADQGLPFERITVPTLVMTGEHDVGSSPRMARLLNARITGSKLAILPRLKHSVLLEAPEQISDLLLDFLTIKKAA